MKRQLNFKLSVDAAKNGIETSSFGASESWKERALQCLFWICQRKRRFIIDDVQVLIKERPPEGRIFGWVMLEGARLGWCEKSGKYQRSAQIQCHANPRTVWRSLVFSKLTARTYASDQETLFNGSTSDDAHAAERQQNIETEKL